MYVIMLEGPIRWKGLFVVDRTFNTVRAGLSKQARVVMLLYY